MAADIYTKPFTSKEGWRRACELVNVFDPDDLVEVIQRRNQIFLSLKDDQKWHPINRKPQCTNSRTHNKWVDEGCATAIMKLESPAKADSSDNRTRSRINDISNRLNHQRSADADNQ